MNVEQEPEHAPDVSPERPARLWWLAVGFAVWGVALNALYALHALGCAFEFPDATIRLVLGAVLLVHFLVGAGLVWYFLRARRRWARLDGFLGPIGLWTLAAAMAAIVGTFGPALFLTSCV